MELTTKIQFRFPFDLYRRLINHPDCPGWRGRQTFYIQIFKNYMNSPEFKLGEVEYQNRRLQVQLDAVKRQLDQKTKEAEAWRKRFEEKAA